MKNIIKAIALLSLTSWLTLGANLNDTHYTQKNLVGFQKAWHGTQTQT